ncbi:MAG: radical SAM family heme chaperone HemW [Thainema sp.]
MNHDPTRWHGNPQAAYVHIPFCRRRCFYCDFPISVVGDRKRGETSGTIAQYVDELCQEIIATPKIANRPLRTVFFGGGTPSLLAVEQVQQILDTLHQQFGIAAPAEISMEMDPGTFDLAHVTGYREAGVNRISLGVQAFDDDLLERCGRFHRVADVYQAVDLLKTAGVKNFSLDLISGLPTQTLTQWQTFLKNAIALQPAHISVYDLTIEPMTPFGRQYEPGLAPLPSDEATTEMYRMAQQVLTQAGYRHYEISNYAQPGYECRHNLVYWHNQPYYGFGMGAASYINNQRFSRPRTRREYFDWVAAYQQNHGKIECDRTSPTEQMLDTLMLNLRLADGIPLVDLQDRFGAERLRQVSQILLPFCDRNWIILKHHQSSTPTALSPQATQQLLTPLVNRNETCDRNPDLTHFHLCLSDPEGFLFSNVVLSSLFQALDGET